MRRGFHRPSEDTISTSFLDLLSNGVGAAILLLLIFTISRGIAAPEKQGGNQVLRARFLLRDLMGGDQLGGSKPVAAAAVQRQGLRVSLPLESLGRDLLVRRTHWTRHDTGVLAATPIGVATYPAQRGAFTRDYDIVVENPGDDCWSFSLRFIDRERARGYEGEERGVEVAWVTSSGNVRPSTTLLPNDLSEAQGLRLSGSDGSRHMVDCVPPNH